MQEDRTMSSIIDLRAALQHNLFHDSRISCKIVSISTENHEPVDELQLRKNLFNQNKSYWTHRHKKLFGQELR